MIEIRQLTPAHADDYRTLRLEALQTAPDAFLTTYEEQITVPVETIAEMMAKTLDEGGLYLGAYDGDTMVGMMIAIRPPRIKRRHLAYVVSVYVAPKYRRQRVAFDMMNEVLDWSRAQEGLEILQLSVAANNTGARQLYEALGFQTWGIEPKAFKLEGDDGYTDEVHMARSL